MILFWIMLDYYVDVLDLEWIILLLICDRDLLQALLLESILVVNLAFKLLD